jgi:hypothetical protein
MDRTRLRELYLQKGLGELAAAEAVACVEELETYLSVLGGSLDAASQDDVARYIALLVETGGNTRTRLLALARYFELAGARDIYLYFTSLFGSVGVVDSIREQARRLEGSVVADEIFRDLTVPPLGTPPAEMPACARRLMEGLRSTLPRVRARAVLCGNHHGIPKESFRFERQRYLESGSLEDYLQDRHRRMVDELQTHCDEGRVWFEQTITQRVVDFVRKDQEILSAVRVGDALLATKIPYDPDHWLSESDPAERRYLACHCPFVRESLKKNTGTHANQEPSVPADWCYCSAGFEKLLFDEVLDADLQVELVESVLQGQDRCRFRIHLPEGTR